MARAPQTHSHNLPDSFAAIGNTFNTVTAQLEGGITAKNSAIIQNELTNMQTRLTHLMQQQPDQFQGETAIHAQSIVDQINLELTAVKSAGSDPYAAKYINDVQRDLLDIVNADAGLTGLAAANGQHGFAAVPDLLSHPAQFRGNAEQTAFMQGYLQDAINLGNAATALADHGLAPGSAEAAALISSVQTFVAHSNDFTVAQGGLYSARFNNEFAADGVNGTASRALIAGLQSGDAAQIHAAANVLAANAADVASNMLGVGAAAPPPGPGIPAHIDTFAIAGTVFNDATTRLIGGVFDGLANDGNRQAIINDLMATQTGLTALLTDHPEQFQGRAGADTARIITLLGKEMTAVANAGTDPHADAAINHLQQRIASIVAHDAVLKAAALDGGAIGFAALPGAAGPAGQHHDGGGHGIVPMDDAAIAMAHPVTHLDHLWA